MAKTITIAELMERKEKLKSNKKETQTLYIESLEDHIVIKKPDRQLVSDALGMSDSSAADALLVYNCVISPDLKDQELQQGFGCIEPTDIVDMIFEAGEVTNISGHCIQLAGYGTGVKAVDKELKKK